ncbi:MAG: hypothetical protein KKB51_10310 [Candidatus Riflebacteria bacterium]|nr:hypothetical protein [Candidatus Riflebacteria bacterium]
MKVRSLLLLACLFIPLATSGLWAQTIDYDGLRITALPDLAPKSHFGYAVCRVLITNSSNRDRDIRLFMRAQYSRDLEEISRSFKLASGEVREESLLIPIMEFYASGMRIEIDGTLLKDQGLHRDFRCYRNYYNRKQALVDSRISRTDFDASFAGTGAGTSLNLEMNQFEGSLAQLYQTWLGYSQFNVLIFYANSINEMPEAVKRAIFDYVRTGGTLLTVGSINLPEDFVSQMQSKEDLSLNLRLFDAGFGKVVVAGDDLLKLMSDGTGRNMPDYLSDLFGNHEFSGDSPLRFAYDETDTLSTRWLMVIVYLFAFLIGPVNVFVLHRLGRKIMVFLTVPVASAVCCLFIYGYYLVFESATFRVKRQALTLLDERFNRAVTLANYALFSSSSRTDGLRFDNETEIFAYGGNDGRIVDGGKFISLDEDQHLSTGWIKPKVPRYLHVRSLQTRRERVGVTIQDGKLQILNGLGADIENIMLMTQDGRRYRASNITAGNQATMEVVKSSSAPTYRSPAEIFPAWFKELRNLQTVPEQFLRPGSYVAKIKTSPFVAQAIDNQADKSENSYVIGILKGDQQP